MPSLDEGEPGKPRVAGLLALHLVSQILDEAYVIATAAEDSGQPWRYLSLLKNIRSGKLGDAEEDLSFTPSKGDSDIVNESQVENVVNVVATSTPQKIYDESIKLKTEPAYIGQGDEEFDTPYSDLSQTTSMFINNLFDMSEVVVCHETEVVDTETIQNFATPNDLLTQAMIQIMESYVNTAFDIAFEREIQVIDYNAIRKEAVEEHSRYTFLADGFDGDVANDKAFFIDNDSSACDHNDAALKLVGESLAITKQIENRDELMEESIQKNNVAFYENTYLTLNRDYDQCSDDDGDPVLQDTKGMIMQEVDLISANISEQHVSTHIEEKEERKALTAISAVSGVSSRKSKISLVSRCRSQGARLLSCLRGWWRRKTPGKRKEARPQTTLSGICPLSPNVRRRASTLLDQRGMYSPTTSRSVVWKFNTVNETLVNSSHWQDYSFETKPEDCGEQ